MVLLGLIIGVNIHGHEALQEADVLGEVGEDPELEPAGGGDEAEEEEDVLDDGEHDDEHEEAGGGHGEVVDPLAGLHGPEGEEADSDDAQDDRTPRYVVVPGRRVIYPDIGVITIQENLIIVHLQSDLPLLLLLLLPLILHHLILLPLPLPSLRGGRHGGLSVSFFLLLLLVLPLILH